MPSLNTVVQNAIERTVEGSVIPTKFFKVLVLSFLRSFPMPRAAYIPQRNLKYASLHGRIIGTLPAVKTVLSTGAFAPAQELGSGYVSVIPLATCDTHDPVEETL